VAATSGIVGSSTIIGEVLFTLGGSLEIRVGPNLRPAACTGISTGYSWVASSLPIRTGLSSFSSLVVSGLRTAGTTYVQSNSYLLDSFSNVTLATSAPTVLPTRRPTLGPTGKCYQAGGVRDGSVCWHLEYQG
jgi:hypothetical protein